MEIKRDSGRSVPANPRLQQIDSGWSDAKLVHFIESRDYMLPPFIYCIRTPNIICYCWLYNHLNLKNVISHVMKRPLKIEWKKWKNKGNERTKEMKEAKALVVTFFSPGKLFCWEILAGLEILNRPVLDFWWILNSLNIKSLFRVFK